MKDETHIFILILEYSIHIWINDAYIKIYTYVRIIYIFNNKDNFLLTSFSLLSNISLLSSLSKYLPILLLVKVLLLTYVVHLN